jgi:fatty-acyl-CoA synthase
LLGRFAPGDHVAIWSPNCPEWVLLEFGAALAGITLVTANPAYLAKELVYVLKQSRAHGIFICPEYRGRDFRGVLRQIAADVPNLREVICLSDWSDFLKSGGLIADCQKCALTMSRKFNIRPALRGFPRALS